MNNTPTISCPKCGAEIPLTEAISHRIREELTADFDRQRQEQSAALAAREGKLETLQADLAKREASLDASVARQLASEREQLLAAATRAAEQKVGVEISDLRTQLQSQAGQLQTAREAELSLRKQKRELEDARENLNLELARQLDAERAKIADTVRQQTVAAERLKLADKEEVIKGLQQQIEALSQRAEQGSMQLQGEALEVTIERDLHEAFPSDEIAGVKKGERGADIHQQVRTNGGLDCGSILWEAKRAKNWAPAWIPKLKEDQRDAKAELAVLITTCPPEGVRGIGQVDGIWVCEPAFACALAVALRQGLVSTAVQRSQESGRADKMAQLYAFLCSVEFRQHIEGVVESFGALQEQLAAEQRAFGRQWKERGQQIAKALRHTAMLYGSIQGIAGRAALPEIQSLQLPGSVDPSSDKT